MNQLKSNLASSPARLARLVTRISSPVHCDVEDAQRLDDRPAALDGTGGVLQQHALTIALGEDDGAAVPSRRAMRQRGQRRRGADAVRVLRLSLALRPRCLAASSRSALEGLVAGRPAEFVREVRRVGGDLVQAGEQAQGFERGLMARGQPVAAIRRESAPTPSAFAETVVSSTMIPPENRCLELTGRARRVAGVATPGRCRDAYAVPRLPRAPACFVCKLPVCLQTQISAERLRRLLRNAMSRRKFRST